MCAHDDGVEDGICSKKYTEASLQKSTKNCLEMLIATFMRHYPLQVYIVVLYILLMTNFTNMCYEPFGNFCDTLLPMDVSHGQKARLKIMPAAPSALQDQARVPVNVRCGINASWCASNALLGFSPRPPGVVPDLAYVAHKGTLIPNYIKHFITLKCFNKKG